ncbi:MAG: hypothetical protein J5793_03670 [Clostridia bacterium]|nr:hypothetical protein [Clostridia bacterium]
MKKATVKYSEKQKNKAISFLKAAKAYLVCRLPGNGYFTWIKESAAINRRLKTKESRAFFRRSVLGYLMGGALTDRIFKRQAEASARFIGSFCRSEAFEYTPRRYLYHYVPEELLGTITEQGLNAPDGSGTVYLSYSPAAMRGYTEWKTAQLKRDAVFVLVKIDARRLSEKHKIYNHSIFEVVTDRIEPEFLIV